MLPQTPRWHWKSPHLLIPLFVWLIWFAQMTSRWHLLSENWFMSVTMAVGSFIAGATSEGGGAVAFPVMTLLFQVKPAVARDFSLMIQSVGMTAAAITIFWQGIRVERHALLFSSLGGAIGIILSLEWIAPLLSPLAAKLFFVTLWLSFGLALLLINRNQQRLLNPVIMGFRRRDALILLLVGMLGGIVSGITGSGLDILTFSLLVLGFRIDEKIATPTSVVLMAGNAVVGFSWRLLSAPSIAQETWNYWWVCIPVVVVGAPLGARFISTRSNLFVVKLLLTSILLQFGAAILILPLTPRLMGFAIATFTLGLLFFLAITHLGYRRLVTHQQVHLQGLSPLSDPYSSTLR